MLGFIVYIACALLLVAGYLCYGRLAEKVYGVNPDMSMPCVTRADGVDFVQMPTWRIFLIQLLNIAGLGPVVGAISGCLFGPVSLLWIVLGCVLAGAMHDFMSAAMSATRQGENLPEIVGAELGKGARYGMRLVCIFLLLMVGVVFTLLPAGMLGKMFGLLPAEGWSLIILFYYFLATVLPVNAIIGRIYPVFGALFLFMAVGLAIMLPARGYEVLPDLDFLSNQHPAGISIWPMLFVTIACGAISGFHATQSPMMVRCLNKAANLRRVFYGAMIVEGLVALVWCVVGLSLREVIISNNETLGQMIVQNPSAAVHAACNLLLGSTGGMLAVLGVVVLAVTSGDTAMRSCRLMLADVIHVGQARMMPRLALAVPLFAAVVVISQLDFSVIWRYFGWGNQTLSCITLWSIAVCLRRRGRSSAMALVPALLMTCVCTSFLLHAPECAIRLPLGISTAAGCLLSLVCCVAFYRCARPAAENAA